MNLYDFGDLLWSWFWDVMSFVNRPICSVWGIDISILNTFIVFFIIDHILDIFTALFGIFDGVSAYHDESGWTAFYLDGEEM